MTTLSALAFRDTPLLRPPKPATAQTQTLWARRSDEKDTTTIETMEKIIYGVNFTLMFLLARFEYNSDSDKTIIISSLGLLILVILNLLLGFFSQMDKKKIYKHYYYSALGLVVSSMILL